MPWNRLGIGRKAETPTRFVVVSLPRSGTHMLRSVLNQHPHIRTEIELFNEYFEPCRERLGRSAEWILENVAWREDSARIRGFTAFLDQGQPWKLWEHLLTLKGVRYVCLRRRNLLEQYVSLQEALVHKQWHAVKRREDLPALHTLRLEPAAVECFFRSAVMHWNWFERAFARRPRQTLWYEDLCAHTEVVSRQVQQFLGAEIVSGLRPETVKVGRRASELISNYDELCDYFAGSEHALHFQPASDVQRKKAA